MKENEGLVKDRKQEEPAEGNTTAELTERGAKVELDLDQVDDRQG